MSTGLDTALNLIDSLPRIIARFAKHSPRCLSFGALCALGLFPTALKAQTTTQVISGTIISDAGSIPAGTSVDVVLKESNTKAIEGRTITLGTGGTYSMTVPAGVYTVKFKTDRTLASNVSVGVATSDATANVTLRAGDETNNNIVDVDDEFNLLSAFDCSEGDGTGLYEDYPTADFNYDGIIDVNDLFALLSNFNVKGDALLPSIVSGSVVYNTDTLYNQAWDLITDGFASDTSTTAQGFTGAEISEDYPFTHVGTTLGAPFYPEQIGMMVDNYPGISFTQQGLNIAKSHPTLYDGIYDLTIYARVAFNVPAQPRTLVLNFVIHGDGYGYRNSYYTINAQEVFCGKANGNKDTRLKNQTAVFSNSSDLTIQIKNVNLNPAAFNVDIPGPVNGGHFLSTDKAVRFTQVYYNVTLGGRGKSYKVMAQKNYFLDSNSTAAFSYSPSNQ